MKDYKLSEAKTICNMYGNKGDCHGCEFLTEDNDCILNFTPDTWDIESNETEQSVVHTIDNVNHPAHYTSGCGFECFEMLRMVLSDDELYGFCLGNAIKYIWRHQQKGGMEDIRKARWYLEKIMDVLPKHYPDPTYQLVWEKVDKLLNQ